MAYDPRYDPRYQQPSPYGMAPMAPAPMNMWRCPYCTYQGQAIAGSKVSTAGWVTFTILLLCCLPLFWIGLLIREPITKCPQCLRS